ncbi:MAG TPA: hypothetical protein V6C78_24035 [Crinalium sp.]|jgi:hypothetical protein
MRHKLSFIVMSGLLALWLGGCGSEPTTPVAESPSAAPAPATPASPAPNASAQPFTQPTVAVSPTVVGDLPPDLISSTDPNQRLRSIQRNRPDPFALVPTTPVIERSPQAEVQQQQSPPTPALAPTGPVAVLPGSQPQSPGSLAPIPQLVPNTTPPQPPRAELARAVQVTGVVQVGNTINAIVKAPNEPTSRYVRVGQYLSNGQILVKRIDVNRPEPVVIFEQDGVEVIVAVGEGGPPADNGPTASAGGSQLTASLPF